MKKISLAGVALAVMIVGPVTAADLGVAPLYRAPAAVYSWTGCYVGGNVGEGWSRQNANETAIDPTIGFNSGSASAKTSGVIGGVHAGCNVEGTYGVARGVVIGLESDWSATKLSDTQIAANTLAGVPVGVGSVTFSENTKWLVSIRGRAGVAVLPNVLLYGTVGVAWNHTDYSGLHIFTACPNCSAVNYGSRNFGWVAGGGIEWAMGNSNWIARAEALYYDISGASPRGLQLASGNVSTTWYWNDLQVIEARVGLSYKFGATSLGR